MQMPCDHCCKNLQDANSDLQGWLRVRLTFSREILNNVVPQQMFNIIIMLSSTLTVRCLPHFQAVFSSLQDRSEILAFGMKRNGVQAISWEKNNPQKNLNLIL